MPQVFYFVPEPHKCRGLGPGAVAEYAALEATGIHCFAELYDCPKGLLNDEAFVAQSLREAVDHGMATLLHEVSHSFHPQGVTALGLIAESHVAIHTWPEYGYAAADVFTCGDQASAEKACAYLVRALQAKRHVMRKLDRGLGVAAGCGTATTPASVPVSQATD